MKKFTLGLVVLVVAGLVGYVSTTIVLNKNNSFKAGIFRSTPAQLDRKNNPEKDIESVSAAKDAIRNPITAADTGFTPTITPDYYGVDYSSTWSPKVGPCAVEQMKVDGIVYQIKQLKEKLKYTIKAAEKNSINKFIQSLEKDKIVAEKALAKCHTLNSVRNN